MRVFIIADIERVVIAFLRVAAVIDDAAGKAGRDFLHIRNIRIDDERPVFGNQLREAAERTTDVGKILEEIQMVRVYVEDDADLRIQRQKAVGILAGFGDKVRGMPDTDLPADALQHAADRNRRIVIRMQQDFGDHGGRCCFAVGAGDGDRHRIIAHDFAEKLCPRQMVQTKLHGLYVFGIVRMNGRRENNEVQILCNILFFLAVRDRNSFCLEPPCYSGGRSVRTRNFKAPAL